MKFFPTFVNAMRCLLSKYNNEITPPPCVDFQRVISFYSKSTRQRVNETTSEKTLTSLTFDKGCWLLNPSHPFPTSLHHSITSSLKKTHQCVFIFIGIIDTSLLVDSLTCWLVDLYKLHHFITPFDIINLKQKISWKNFYFLSHLQSSD